MSGYTIRSGLPYVQMAAGETLDWSRDWAAQLEADETISTSAWEIAEGLTAGIASLAGAVATQWVTSSEAGAYAVTNQVTTSAGRVMRRTLMVEVVAQL